MSSFKIIHTDNFNGDYPDEKFVTELPYGMTEEEAQKICDAINSCRTQAYPDAPRFYKVVPADYKLLPGFEP